MKYIRNINILAAVLLMIIASSSLSADKYDLDMAHSSIGFNVSHMLLAKVNGSFADYSVELYYDADEISNSSVKTVIQVSSIGTGNMDRDNHLKSPDFFDAATYPEITFNSGKIMKKGDKYMVQGDFTMRGITKNIEFPFELKGPINDPWGNTRLGIEAHLEINRQDYNVKWSKTLDNGGLVAGDIIDIEIFLEVIKSK